MNTDQYSIRPFNPLTREKMGKALIINNYAYDGGRLSLRHGSLEDLKRMENLMEYLNFEVIVKQDLRSVEILTEVKNFVDSIKASGRGFDMASVILMGHGTRESILGIDEEGVKYDEIFSLFNNENCRALVGKPKLFIIQVHKINNLFTVNLVFFMQACRGNNLDIGIDVCFTDGGAAISKPKPEVNRVASVFKDYLIANATVDEYVSYRNVRGKYCIFKKQDND